MAKKAPKQVPPTLANRHPDEATEQLIEARAAELYPTGCHVLFGREQAYVMPTDWNAGPGHVMPYAGSKRKVIMDDLKILESDRPDPLSWLRL